jgi:hypothetical protein
MIKKIKSNIVTSIKNRKINVFFIFLLMSFLILIFSKLSKEYINTIGFNVKQVNVPKEYVILNDSNATINITLKTIGFNWLKYYFSKPEITVDFKTDVTKRDSFYILNNAKILLNKKEEFGNQVELLNASPDNLYFRFDVNSVRKIPVLADVELIFSPGYDTFNSIKISPDSVQVIGPNSLVDSIKSVKTETLKIEKIKDNILQKIKLKLPINNDNLTFSNAEVELAVEVEKFTEGSVKVPVDFINVPENLKIKFFPKTINVLYYTSLNKFSEISSKDFKVICDYNKVSDNQSFLLPDLLKITEKVKSAKINKQHIEFIITE